MFSTEEAFGILLTFFNLYRDDLEPEGRSLCDRVLKDALNIITAYAEKAGRAMLS
jgi:hypothetical protein